MGQAATVKINGRRVLHSEKLTGAKLFGDYSEPGMFAPVRNNLRYGAIRAGLEAAALGAFLRPVGGRGLVFTLHHVRPAESQCFDPNAILAITPEFLDQAIQTALAAGLTPVHIHELPSLLANHQDSRKYFGFGLDDGYRNNLEYAAPVFRRHNVPFTIFVTAGFVNRTRTIWWDTAAAIVQQSKPFIFDFGQGDETVRPTTAMDKARAYSRFVAFVKRYDEEAAVMAIDECAVAIGIDPRAIVDRLVMTIDELRASAVDPLIYFGAHSVSHVNLTRVSDDRLDAELSYSAQWVKDNTGYLPRSFAYPYGWSSAAGQREFEAARRHGFDIALTTRPGVLGRSMAIASTSVPRVSLNGLYQKPRYVRALISGLPFTAV